MLTSLLSLLNGIILIALGVGITWFWKTYDARQAAAKQVAEDNSRWRQQRLDTEAALREEIKAERAERLQWQLKREAELASIAGILEESTEVQKLVAGLVATQQAHGGEITQINNRMNLLQQHVNNLTLSFPHAKP